MLDPKRPYAHLTEREPYRDELGNTVAVDVNTVFLTASRCPIGCSMCDLHANTLPQKTEAGNIPEQIRFAESTLRTAEWIKLYNSGNFFDAASIPPSDYDTIARLCEKYERVVIENHPRIGRKRHKELLSLLQPKLEVAVGLESVQPRVLARLQKQMTRDQFDHYARFLGEASVDLRVFLILGAPELSVRESLRWTRLSVRHALQMGARHVSIIPARSGHGWNGGASRLPTLGVSELTTAFCEALDDAYGRTCVSVDLWDISRQSLGDGDRDLLGRLEHAILSQDASFL